MASMVEGEVHIPGIGNMSKKAALGGGAVALTIVGIAYYRHRNSAASTAAASTAATDASSAIDPATNMPYSQEYAGGIDPNTNQPYALEGGYGGYYGSFGGNTSIGAGTPSSSSTFSNNADWSTAAENELASIGVSEQAAGSAISKILAGLPVTVDQQDLFLEAKGLLGEGPPNGYPQPIKLTDSSGHPGATKIKVPNVVGIDVEQATQILQAEGLKANGPKGVPGKIHIVTSTSPGTNSMVNTGTTVTLHFKTEIEKTTTTGHKSGGGGVIHR